MAARYAAVLDSSFEGTNIDRRKCSRVVPMKVLVLGLSRTGTSSVREALFQLGYDHVYHMASTMQENPRDSEMWLEAIEAKFEEKGSFGKPEWDQLLGHCMAVTDFPAVAFGPELIDAYPKAKVILSVRDSVGVWHESMLKTLWPLTKPSLLRHWGFGGIIGSFRPSFYTMSSKLFEYVFQNDIPRTGRQVYEEHNALIKSIVAEDNLLVFNVKEGWGPLCKFLGHPVPVQSFPRANDMNEMTEKRGKGKQWTQETRDAISLIGVASVLVVLGTACVMA